MNRVISILGATCTGKTSLALYLSEELKKYGIEIEIINVDSIQVYKHLNIGSAKPSKEERKIIKHHLLDIIELEEDFNANDFVLNALSLIKDIKKRGKVPFLVGGTGFYFLSLFCGMSNIPKIPLEIREKVSYEEKTVGIERLYLKIKELDPIFSSRISERDSHRIKRALEVIYYTKKPYSSYLFNVKKNNIASYNIGIDFNRKILYEKINKRVEKMFLDGLEEEIEELKKSFNISLEKKGIRKAIGYKEFFLFNNKDLIKEEIKKNTRRYAKRQICFFKKISNINFLDGKNIFNNDLKKNIIKYIDKN